MTRHKGRTVPGGYQPGPEHTPRLRLKPKTPTTGHVDGAWWPRSDDLAEELPDLLAVLSVRLGPVGRVMYNLAEWAKMPPRLTTGGRAVRLDGYRLQPANTLQVQGIGRESVLLLVVPPDTDRRRRTTRRRSVTCSSSARPTRTRALGPSPVTARHFVGACGGLAHDGRCDADRRRHRQVHAVR